MDWVLNVTAVVVNEPYLPAAEPFSDATTQTGQFGTFSLITRVTVSK